MSLSNHSGIGMHGTMGKRSRTRQRECKTSYRVQRLRKSCSRWAGHHQMGACAVVAIDLTLVYSGA